MATRNCYISPSLLLERPSRQRHLPAPEREYALKQSRCLDALEAYFAEARKTMELLEQSRSQPSSLAERGQLLAQRDREAEAQRRYLHARKLFLHLAKISCGPSQRNGD